MTTFDLNGRAVSVHSPDDVPLLWVIRDELAGCGKTTFDRELRFSRSLL